MQTQAGPCYWPPAPQGTMEMSEEMNEMARAWANHGPGGAGIHAPGEADSLVDSYPFFSN